MAKQAPAGAEFEKEFEKGFKMLSQNHFGNDGVDVKLDIPTEWLPLLHPEVQLLSPTLHLERELVYLYTEELIQLFPAIQEEGKLSNELLAVFETLLHAMDYMTHERFLNAPFGEQDRDELEDILRQVFDEKKTSRFTESANRPLLNKSQIFSDEEKVFAKDERKERTRIYMAILYKKSENMTEHFSRVGHWLGEVKLKPNTARLKYAEVVEGKTDIELHERTLLYLNIVKQTLSWLLNSASLRGGELYTFDRMDIASKLGIYR